MNRIRRFSLAALLLLAVPPCAARAAAGDAETAVVTRTFEFEIIEHEAAEAIAWKTCPAGRKDLSCRVVVAEPRSLTVAADLETLARIAAAIAAAESVPRSQVFQVVLLQAENNGDAGLDKLPAEARRALEDARDFLPYSGYQMLGSALLRTDAHARSIVNGPEGRDYSASLTYHDTVTAEGHRLVVRQFALDRLVSARPAAEQAIETLPVIGTSFTMRPGETVIVGTSKLEGADRALVVLLTNVQ